MIATATSASDAASAPRAIAQAVATLTAPNVSTTSSRHLELADLGGVRIGDIACLEHVGRAGDLGQRGADEPAGAAFGDGDAAAGGAVGVDHLARLVDQLVGKQGVAHFEHPIRMLATAWAAMPSRRPVKPSPSVVVALMLTWSIVSPAISAIRARMASR